MGPTPQPLAQPSCFQGPQPLATCRLPAGGFDRPRQRSLGTLFFRSIRSRGVQRPRVQEGAETWEPKALETCETLLKAISFGATDHHVKSSIHFRSRQNLWFRRPLPLG